MNRFTNTFFTYIINIVYNTGIVFRVIADIVSLFLSYSIAFILRFIFEIFNNYSITIENERNIVSLYLYKFLYTFPIIVIIAIIIFSVSGFYTRGRLYQSKYKIILMFNSNSLSWLVFSFLLFFISITPLPPRSVIIMGWLFSTLLLISSRLVITMWQRSINLDLRYARKYYSKNRAHNVLIIGGAGYIGSILVRQLLKEGYRIRILDLFLYGKESIIDIQSNPRLEIFEGDSRNINTVIRAMDGVDTVVHLGEIVGDPACSLNDNLTIDINVAATKMIVQAAQGFGVNRFIYISSCSVYGFSKEWLNEQSSLNPVSLYAKAKITAEKTLYENKENDFNFTILRLGTVFGMSFRPRFDLVINLLTAKAIQDKKITIIGGNQWRPFVHVADVVQVIAKVIKSPVELVNRQMYNVGYGNYTIDMVADIINKKIPSAEKIELNFNDDPRNYRLHFNKLHKELKYKPENSIEYGIDEIIKAYKEGVISDYNNKQYSNYSVLKDYNEHLVAKKLAVTDF